MTTETVLKDEDLVRILKFGASSITMGRAIEKAVLQSPEVQQMRKDAGRWRRWAPYFQRQRRMPFDLAKDLDRFQEELDNNARAIAQIEREWDGKR